MMPRGRWRPTLAATGGWPVGPRGTSPLRGPCGPFLSSPQPNTAAKQTATPHSHQASGATPPAPHPPAPRPPGARAGVRGQATLSVLGAH